jgi:hypothetical protein
VLRVGAETAYGPGPVRFNDGRAVVSMDHSIENEVIVLTSEGGKCGVGPAGC